MVTKTKSAQKVRAGKKAAATRKQNEVSERQRKAAFKAGKTMLKKYGENCRSRFAIKAAATRKKNAAGG